MSGQIPKSELTAMRERAMEAPANGGSVTDIIRLLQDVERLEERRERLDRALEFLINQVEYGDYENALRGAKNTRQSE